ncbi:MAG: antibiotic biosynthesis monooxygenase [Deltaproteobacteria bacterium]|nr:antibiotic biosynthesis monooxygenase [Deltaproteobacteria bacterium]MBW2414278.1 antibiotic biosynthesis monooxygenase [Deltaproteobacteria bacterium]
MYIATNRFSIGEGRETEFEEVWRSRDSHLDEVPGFQQFRLLRGATEDGATLYISHTQWESREAFEAWTRSDSFRKSHARTGSSQGVVLSHPKFEGFEQVL